MSDVLDLVVVGAGWFGLAAAKVYLELHPNEKIQILEAANSCGGTWSEDRIYPGLKSNNLHGTYEYPDFPMDPEVYGVKPGEHVPGGVLHRYLTDFAKRFGVFSRAQFNTTVEAIKANDDDSWTLHTSKGDAKATLITRRLILATGLTSTPNFPQYPGKDDFMGPYFHAKDFHRNGDTIHTSKNAVVVGGAKSAYDVAYAYAEAGVQVDLVIRPTGNGPVWIAHPYVDFGLRLEKLLQVRALTCFNPCPWGPEGGYASLRNFLHGTSVGRWIVDNFWHNLSSGVVKQNGYQEHEETKKLEPWNSAFWIGSGLSIHNYDQNLFEMVKNGKIRVHIADVDHLSANAVHLTNGERLEADVVVCSTGWKKSSPLSFVNLSSAGIGLPYSREQQVVLNEKYDAKVLDMYPRLKDQPPLAYTPKADSDPFRLYRFMVPPIMLEKKNLVFAGAVSSVNTSICASAQALWISAFLDGKLDRLATSQEDITREVMLHTQFGKWRYPCGYGATLPDFVFDALPYTDMLLRDLGIQNWRKPNNFKEFFAPYGPEDYIGLVDEWSEKHAK